jgi:dihydroorotate dehydrogenase electron transfer subunit
MKCEVTSNVFLKDRHLVLELAAPPALRKAVPGQFLHIRIEDSCDPLLRRPLSIHDVSVPSGKKQTKVRILSEVVGKGTSLLSQKKPFSTVDVLGPLGHGFDLKALSSFETVYVVAGGMGVAPLFYLAKRLLEVRKATRRSGGKGKVVVLIGGRTKEHVLREREFKALGCDVHLATDDGSRGFKGRVTQLLEKELLSGATHAGSRVICACGPKPMLAALTSVAKKNDIPAYVSLEEFMGCGLGACLGCVIRTASGYKRICHDGPVFPASEVMWGK